MGKRLTELQKHERVVIDWLSTYCGFKEDASGTLVGTLRNLLAEHAEIARKEQRDADANIARDYAELARRHADHPEMRHLREPRLWLAQAAEELEKRIGGAVAPQGEP